LDDVAELIRFAQVSLELPKNGGFYWDAMKNLLEYYCHIAGKRKVYLLVEIGRKTSKEESGRKSGLSIVGGLAIRDLLGTAGRSAPALVMLRQEGTRQLGWTAGKPFWWPVLAAPTTGAPCVFSNP
jgi:hypothetical protein